MTSHMRFGLGLAVALASVACGGPKSDAPAPAATAAATTTAPAAPAAPVAAAGEIGVPECDSYVRKYHACIETHVPEAARPMVKQSLEQSVQAWKAGAAQAQAHPEARNAMASACKQAEDAAKTAMAAYKCEW